jgi:hypothetical protein
LVQKTAIDGVVLKKDATGAQDGSARNPHRTVWRAMSDSFNVFRLTRERRERADRQRVLASVYRLEAAVAHIPADVRPAVVQAVAKALKQERPDAFRRLPSPWCERLLEWWDLRIETKRKARVVVPLR